MALSEGRAGGCSGHPKRGHLVKLRGKSSICQASVVLKVPASHGWKRKGHFKLAVGRREPVAEGEVDAGAFHGAVCSVGRGCGGSTELLQRSRCRYSYIPWRLKLMVLCAAILGSLAVCVVVKMEYLAGLH